MLPEPLLRWLFDSVAHLCLTGAVTLGSASAGTMRAIASCMLGSCTPFQETFSIESGVRQKHHVPCQFTNLRKLCVIAELYQDLTEALAAVWLSHLKPFTRSVERCAVDLQPRRAF